MKTRIAVLIPCLTYACGTDHVDHRNRAPIKLVQANPLAVESVNNLPSCNKDTEDRLIYIKDLDLFRRCNGQTWIASGTEAPNDQNGAKASPSEQVIALQKIATSAHDLCPGNVDFSCFFSGGSAVKYADGSIRYKASISKVYKFADAMHEAGSTESVSVSMHHQSSWDASELILLHGIKRNSITSAIFLQFDAGSNKFTVAFDADQDGHITGQDEILMQAALLNL